MPTFSQNVSHHTYTTLTPCKCGCGVSKCGVKRSGRRLALTGHHLETSELGPQAYPINQPEPRRLLNKIHGRNRYNTGGCLADEQMYCRTIPVFESVFRVSDACRIFVRFTAGPVSIRRRVTVVPYSLRLYCDRQKVQSKPVVVDVQKCSVFTSISTRFTVISQEEQEMGHVYWYYIDCCVVFNVHWLTVAGIALTGITGP